MDNRPKFGQWVLVKACAVKVRTPLGDNSFKTEYQRRELGKPMRGVFIGNKKGRVGITDAYAKTIHLEEGESISRRRFRPGGPALELWRIAVEGQEDCYAFPEDVSWRRPQGEERDSKFIPGDIVEVNESYPGEDWWGRLAIVLRSYPMFTIVTFITDEMVPYNPGWHMSSDELDLVMGWAEFEAAYPGFYELVMSI